MNNLYSKNEVVGWLLAKGQEEDVSITPKKLQKMLYYVYAWGLVFLNETADELKTSVFDGNFEAWVHGPVDADIYRNFAQFGFEEITTMPEENVELSNTEQDEVVKDVLDQVWNTYAQFNANQLEMLTHQETPWKEIRAGHSPLERVTDQLNDKTIFEFYGDQLAG